MTRASPGLPDTILIPKGVGRVDGIKKIEGFAKFLVDAFKQPCFIDYLPLLVDLHLQPEKSVVIIDVYENTFDDKGNHLDCSEVARYEAHIEGCNRTLCFGARKLIRAMCFFGTLPDNGGEVFFYPFPPSTECGSGVISLPSCRLP